VFSRAFLNEEIMNFFPILELKKTFDDILMQEGGKELIKG
jgi:hypothetical protein